MHRIDNSTAVAVMPIRKPVGPWGFFGQGSEAAGQPATIVEADILNAVMMEIANVVTKAGLSLNKLDDTQLWTAINQLIGAKSLGFMPVEQGGGAGQGVNKIHLGWGTSGGLRVQVDATDLGPLAFLQQSQNWTQQQNFQGINATDVHSTGGVEADGTLSGANVIASNLVQGLYGRLTYGARGSADYTRVVTMGDFALSSIGFQSFVFQLPDGTIVQGSNGAIPAIAIGTPYAQNFTLPLQFPRSHLFSLATWSGTSPPVSGTIAGVPNDAASVHITIDAPGGPQYGFCYISVGN
jgi:hypothetical protein